MNDLVIQPGEKVLKDEQDVIWLKGWFSKPVGRLYFTTQRLIFEVPKQVVLTASQALANEIANRVPIDIPRDRLEAVEVGKHGKRDNVLVVRTEDAEYKLLLRTPVKEWEAKLRQAMYDDKVALENLMDRLKPKDDPPPYR